jgi:hypothetical protein
MRAVSSAGDTTNGVASPTVVDRKRASGRRDPRALARRLSAAAIAVLVALAVLYAVLAERSYAGQGRSQARRAGAVPLRVPSFVGPARREIAREQRTARTRAAAPPPSRPSDPPTPPPAPPAAPAEDVGQEPLDSAGSSSVS